MLSGWWKAGAALALVALAVAGYRWWASDERAITRQLATIAGALSAAPNERDLGPVTRMATLRKALAPDISVSAGPAPEVSGLGAGTPMTVVGRDQALAMASRWSPAPGSVSVAFVDQEVSVGSDRTSAEVSCTATVTSRGPSGEATVEARELSVGFTKIDGTWVVASVRAEETLTR